MMARRFILAGLCLFSGVCCAAFSRLDAESVVRRTLVERGIRLGYDVETGVYTVIASAARKGVDLESSAFCAQQSECFRMAELKALHQILNMRSQTMSGETSVRRDGAAKAVRSFVDTMSRADLEGCLVVDFHGRQDGETCVAAVAVSWSEDLERRARASAAGTLRPADSWVDELKSWLDGLNENLLPSTVSFVDSAGCIHRVGVGMARFDGESALCRNAAVAQADLLARKNLQLALFGRAAMRKKAELMKSQDRLEGGLTLSSAYEALGEVSADTPLPVGSRVLFDKVVQTGSGQGKVLIVVYGVNSPRVAYGVADLGSQTIAPPPDGVLIWNPGTGKFEKH